MGTAASYDHSRSDCDSSEMDGTRNSTLVRWPSSRSARSRCSRSATLRLVKVLPVPQAMISLPRSWPAKPANTAWIASAWCGRGCFFACRFSSTSTATSPGAGTRQSIGLAAMSARPTRVTGICWSSSASSACGPHFSVVEMIIRRVKPPFPEAVKNRLGDRVIRLVELALDRAEAARLPVLGDQVDPGVLLVRRRPRPVSPQPHPAELLGPRRVDAQVAAHQLLEPGSPLMVRDGRLPDHPKHIVHGGHRLSQCASHPVTVKARGCGPQVHNEPSEPIAGRQSADLMFGSVTRSAGRSAW